jgi:metal-sulfur cluster biosynthetic enzyme
MKLTSPACPLTGVMEDQIQALSLAEIAGGLTGVRIEWSWLPAWRPSAISDEGRDQLRAIGFTNF